MYDKERLITLVTETVDYDSIGQPVPVETYREVFAKLRSVSLTEWTMAGQLGNSASIQAVIWSFEYRGEEVVLVGDRRYHVYRTYDTGDRMELYLEEMVGHEYQSQA